jgi:hypothetical protein
LIALGHLIGQRLAPLEVGAEDQTIDGEEPGGYQDGEGDISFAAGHRHGFYSLVLASYFGT